MLKRLSIKQLLLLAFLLAGLLPAMAVSFLSYFQTRSVLKQEITRDLQTLSNAVSNDIERMLFERMRNVQSWSQLSIMQELAIGDIDKRLSIFLNGLALSYADTYHAIYVEDLQGNIIASNQAQMIGQNKLRKSFWFNANFTNKPLKFYKVDDGILAITTSLLDINTDQPIGTLVVEFNWSTVQNSLNTAMKETTTAALLDGENNVLAATSNWKNIEPQHGMIVTSQFSKQSPIPHWKVRIEKLYSDAVAPVHRLAYIFLGLLVATLLLAAITVRPIANAITQPLSQLTAFVRGFALEKQSKPPHDGPPEVRELGDAFETMTHDLQKSQDKLTRAAKLAAVGEMAAAMSHEVRTPLGILRSSTDVLKREKGISEEGQEVLGFINSETERLNKLVSTLIDAARPRLPVFTNVDLTQLISNVIGLLQAQAEAKTINMIFDSQDRTINAELDADQMIQVLMNLMMNAIQVLPKGGQIAVKLKQTERQTMITVSDNGEGIAAEHQADIFEPFFTKRSGGVGLGLAIVKQIIQAHNGDIHYQTSSMGGAQFTITLPTQTG